MPESWGDKLKNTANKAILTGVMAAQTIMGLGQKVSPVNQDENPKMPEEALIVTPQNEAFADTNETAFGVTAIPENTDTVQNNQVADVSPTEPKKSAIQQKYGFDLVYEPENDKFLLKQDGLYDRGIFKDFTDYDSWAEKLQKQREDKYSHETSINFKEIELKEYLQEGGYLYVARQTTDNKIDVFQYNVKPEEREECLQLLQGKQYGLSEKEAEKLFDILTTTDITEKLSLIEHEKAHVNDEKKAKLDQQDLPPYRMAQLEMLTEVHAYMEQAGLALDMFKANGDLKYFDKINLDMNGLKTTLAENPKVDNPEGLVASYVFKQFMDEHNKEGSTYSDQAYSLANPSSAASDYRVWSYVDNDANTQEYHNRVSAMFENVGGLGDVRPYINPDFELHTELKEKLMGNGIVNKNFLAVMANNADNPKQYSQNLDELLQKVKEIDADGVRTAEETAQLDTYIQSKVSSPKDMAQNTTAQKSETVKDIPVSDKEKIAALSGRSGKYQSPEALAEEKAQALQAQAIEQTPQATQVAQKPTESLQQQAEPAVETLQTKKVADMTPEEKYDFINNNLRKGNNPNLNTQEKSTPVKDNTKVASHTLSPQQIMQMMNRQNSGKGI